MSIPTQLNVVLTQNAFIADLFKSVSSSFLRVIQLIVCVYLPK